MRALVLLASFFLAAFFLLAGFSTVYYDVANLGVYDENAARLDATQGVQQEAVIAYSNGEERRLDFLSTEEQEHMVDVRSLLGKTKTTFLTLFLAFVTLGAYESYRYKKRKGYVFGLLAELLEEGGATTLTLLLAVWIPSFFNFDAFWTLFHVLLFPQGNWQFPSESVLITLFPSAFFASFTMRVVLFATLYAIASLVAGIVLQRRLEAKPRQQLKRSRPRARKS